MYACIRAFRLERKSSREHYAEGVPLYRGYLCGALVAVAFDAFHAYLDFPWHSLPIIALSGLFMGFCLVRQPKRFLDDAHQRAPRDRMRPRPVPIGGDRARNETESVTKGAEFRPVPSRASTSLEMSSSTSLSGTLSDSNFSDEKSLGITGRLVLGLACLGLFGGGFFIAYKELPVWLWSWEAYQAASSPSLDENLKAYGYYKKIQEHSPTPIRLKQQADYLLKVDKAYNEARDFESNSWESLQTAKEMYERAHREKPKDPSIHLAWAKTLSDMERFGEAEEEFRRLLAWAGDADAFMGIRYYYAAMLYKQGWYADLAKDPERAYALCLRAEKELALAKQKGINGDWKTIGPLFYNLQKTLKTINKSFEESKVKPDPEITESPLY